MVSRDEALFNEVSVRKWRGKLVTGDAMFCKFQGWWLWLVARPEYRGLTPTGLLQQLEESGDPRLFRKVALLVDDYAAGVGGTKSNMCGVRSVVRSFFHNHNLELPRTVFNVVETRIDFCDDHHRCIKKDIEELHKKYEKLDKFVKTLAETPMGLVPDVFVVDGCSVRISEDVVGERELGVLRLFGYDSLDEFVCEALRLHLQRSRRL